MKFTDGQWLLQPGVSAHYPAEAYEVNSTTNEIVVTAPTRNIKHRGDTLGGPVLTVSLSSPMEGVIRVRLEHYSGGHQKGPFIPLLSQSASGVKVVKNEGEVVLESGSASAHLKTKDGWELTFKNQGRVMTRSAWRGMGYVQSKDGNFLHDQLSLGVGECVYGLGERFTSYIKNGQVVENQNKDGGTSCEQAYKSVPFYMTNRGYGVLVNETGHVSFEVASEKVARVQFSLQAESLEYFVIAGPTPKEVLRRLTALTGRAALPPAWSFGLWLSTSFTTNYDEATVTSFIKGMEDRKLPLSVFHFDCFWMREFEWCNFEWDPRQFPEPAAMLSRLKARGLRICVWINSYIAQKSKLFAEGVKGGYFIKRSDGSVFQTDLWQPGMAIVDFTNPAACEWYAGHLKRLMDMGVDCFKTDFGERIPTQGVTYFDGSDAEKMHNFYPILYNQCVFNLIEKEKGLGEAVVFARSSYASGQRFPLHWGGDCWSNFESMAESLRGGLSISLSGFAYWSHDIGGFEGNPPKDVYKRWLAFGLLSSHSRLHGSSSYRVPWSIDEESSDVLRLFTRLKCRLMPYLYGQAVVAHREGIPMMRAMMLEYPEDPACDTLDRQYLMGDSLLVAPVLNSEGVADYYLPKGTWTHLQTGEVVEGGAWKRSQHDFLSMPLYIKGNTILPVGNCEDKPDYDFTNDLTFKLYALADGAVAERQLVDAKGADLAKVKATRKGAEITVEISGKVPAKWAVEVVGAKKLEVVGGGTVQQKDLSQLASSASGQSRISLRVLA